MLRFGKTKVAKKMLWCKKTIKIFDSDADNIFILKLIETNDNS